MEIIKISELKPHPRNEEFFDSIMGIKWDEFLKSIKERGVIEPVVITPEKVIVSGHHRVKACRELGIDDIKCVVRLYDNEDDVVRDLIETNIRQRGDVGGSEMKMAARIKELERIYGIQHGAKSFQGNQHEKVVKRQVDASPKTQKDIASELGMDVRTYQRYKLLSDAIPELGDAVDSGKVSKMTAIGIMKKLSEQEQKELLDEFLTADRITTRDVDQYVKQIEESQKAADRYLHDLEETRKEANEARKRAEELEKQIRNAEPKTVEVERVVEVAPDDYESTKDELKKLKEEYTELKEEKDEAERLQNLFSDDLSKASERAAQATRRIRELEDLLKARDLVSLTGKEMEGFTAAAYDFISRFGGKVWTFERMDWVPEDIRRNFVSAIHALDALSQQLINNLGNYKVR